MSKNIASHTFSTASPLSSPPSTTTISPLSDIERDAIEAAIATCGGSIHRAAELLKVAPSTLYRKRQVWVKVD